MKTVLACLAALPLVAQSETLYLQYEGTVTSADPAPWWTYRLGDPVRGLARIDTDLAGPDQDPSRFLAQYGVTGRDFVVSKDGSAMARRGVIIDTVVVAEDSQRYAVRDATQITRPIDGGATTGIEGNLLIDVQRDGLVHGTDIVQSFDAIPANDGSRISGTLFRLFKNVAYRVSFALSRVSLTPGMCRPK